VGKLCGAGKLLEFEFELKSGINPRRRAGRGEEIVRAGRAESLLAEGKTHISVLLLLSMETPESAEHTHTHTHVSDSITAL